MDVDAGAVARHLGERRCEPGGAAVLQRLDEPALDELERDLDQPLAGERIADLDGRALVLRALAELLAREHARAADAVAARRRAVEDEREPAASRARPRHALGRQQADAHRVDEAVVLVGRVEHDLPAHGRHSDGVSVRADSGHSALEVSVGEPKRSPSSSATGRAPIAMMSRRMPPTPVAAPWNGSTAEG